MIGKKLKGLLYLISISAMLCVSVPVMADDINEYKPVTFGGTDRYETSQNIATAYIQSTGTCEGVILSLGTNFPDALSGSILSKKYGIPILLCDKTSDKSKTAFEFIQKNVDKIKPIYILGGPGGITTEFEQKLNSLGYTNIIRLGGLDRYDTNCKIVDNFAAKTGTPVVIVNGDNFPDALSISSIAASKGYPILLTSKDKMADGVKQRLLSISPSKIYIIGGAASISDSNFAQIKSLTKLDSSKMMRLGGYDRYSTSITITKYFGGNSDTISFANGENFPDALSGSAFSALKNSPLVLIKDNYISGQMFFLENDIYSKLVFYGGNGSISDETKSILNGIQERHGMEPTDVTSFFTKTITPDAGTPTNYVDQVWKSQNIYDWLFENPNYNETKANMITDYPASQFENAKDMFPTTPFIYRDGHINFVVKPIAGNSYLVPFNLGYGSENNALIEKQFYSIMNRFLMQSSSKEKICLETSGQVFGSNDETGSTCVTFMTNNNMDFNFGIIGSDTMQHAPADFRQAMSGCKEFISINNLTTDDRLDSLKNCLIGAFGDNGEDLYNKMIELLQSDPSSKFTDYTVKGITVVYDAYDHSFGLK